MKLKKPLILKAVGAKGSERPYVVDATAGLGRDAAVLSKWGCKVLMIERSKILYKRLLEESVLEVLHGDAKDLLPTLVPRPDVIFIDPMYPHSKKSALPKKEMVMVRELVGEDEDAPALLAIALKVAKKRVVVKRPHRAEYLGSIKPEIEYTSKLVRFDVYLRQV